MDMGKQACLEPGAAWEQAACKVEWNAVDVRAQHLPQPDVGSAHQGQRSEEMLTELPIGGPGAALLIALEGKRVDHHRLSGPKLDVVGAGILERHPEPKRLFLDLKGRQCGVV